MLSAAGGLAGEKFERNPVTDPNDPPPIDAPDPAETTVGPRAARPRRKKAEGGQSRILSNGVTLNDIYRVKRFVARGGMGEVYEGVNVNTDERVAIKVILTHLASDAKVQSLFRKEARTLTKFAHPALVQYRVLAKDSKLGLHYIVTDYVEGEPLSAKVGGPKPTPSQIAGLMRRLAMGLREAHAHGAIHRDMSPDNVLLPSGKLEEAKIIDFGIAKDLDGPAATIVGDGFAGKLGYVAPEQFGAFDRRVGPWTDVYSLALVGLAYGSGKAPDMGTTLVDAVHRRTSVADVSGAPPVLHDLFAHMLAPDPSDRPQSMQQVINEIERLEASGVLDVFASPAPESPAAEASPVVHDDRTIVAGLQEVSRPPVETSKTPGAAIDPGATIYQPSPIPAPPEPVAPPALVAAPAPEPAVVLAPPPSAVAPPQKPAGPSEDVPSKKSGLPMMLGLGALVVVVIAVAAFVMMPKSKSAAPAAGGATLVAADPLATKAAADIGCAWLDTRSGDGGAVVVTGVASDPSAANSAIAKAGAASVDTSGVAVVPMNACPTLDALRGLRPAAGGAVESLTVQQPKFEMATNVAGCGRGAWAKPLVTISADPARDVSIFVVEPSGWIRQLVGGHGELYRLIKREPENFAALPGNRVRLSFCDNQAGAVGVVVVDSPAAIDLGLRRGVAMAAPAQFAQSLQAIGKQGGVSHAVWFRVADEQVNAPEAPVVEAPKPLSTVPLPAAVAGEAPPAAAPAAAAPEPAKVASGPAAPAEWLPCRAFVNGAWEERGYASRAACVTRLFTGHCDILSGQSGDMPLRRYNGMIQGQQKGSGFGASKKWRDLAPSTCAAQAPSSSY